MGVPTQSYVQAFPDTQACRPIIAWRRIVNGTMLKRAFASSLVGLLLSVSALAAACDIRCSFPSSKSDCHSRQTAYPNPSSDEMNMSAMDMAGMAMPATARAGTPQSVSAIRNETSSHPSIGEMGPCERQACDENSFVSAKRNLFKAPRFNFVAPLQAIRPATGVSAHAHDARDDVASFPLRDASPPNRSLRI